MATQDHTADGDEITPAPRTLTARPIRPGHRREALGAHGQPGPVPDCLLSFELFCGSGGFRSGARQGTARIQTGRLGECTKTSSQIALSVQSKRAADSCSHPAFARTHLVRAEGRLGHARVHCSARPKAEKSPFYYIISALYKCLIMKIM